MQTTKKREGICGVCGKQMYQSSTGDYECRNFDCPPGTEARHRESWKLRDIYQPLLLKANAARLTVEEVGMVLNPGSGEHAGPALKALAERLGIEANNASK